MTDPHELLRKFNPNHGKGGKFSSGPGGGGASAGATGGSPKLPKTIKFGIGGLAAGGKYKVHRLLNAQGSPYRLTIRNSKREETGRIGGYKTKAEAVRVAEIVHSMAIKRQNRNPKLTGDEAISLAFKSYNSI